LIVGILFCSGEHSLWDLPPRRLEVYLLDRVFATFTFSLCKFSNHNFTNSLKLK